VLSDYTVLVVLLGISHTLDAFILTGGKQYKRNIHILLFDNMLLLTNSQYTFIIQLDVQERCLLQSPFYQES